MIDIGIVGDDQRPAAISGAHAEIVLLAIALSEILLVEQPDIGEGLAADGEAEAVQERNRHALLRRGQGDKTAHLIDIEVARYRIVVPVAVLRDMRDGLP